MRLVKKTLRKLYEEDMAKLSEEERAKSEVTDVQWKCPNESGNIEVVSVFSDL